MLFKQLFDSEIAFYTNEYIIDLPEGFVFVFGSNLAGRHGKGAALTAVKKFEAKYGKGVGFQGRSYGIPTKGYRLDILSDEIIRSYVDDFKLFVASQPKLTFVVTGIGTGLAGKSVETMASMFVGIPRCYFPLSWQPYLGVTP